NMAADGYGIKVIVRTLNAEGVPTIGRGGAWHISYVRRILTTRAAIGEYQSYTGKGGDKKEFGGVVENYFPAVVSEELFYRAQKAMRDRKYRGGPRGKAVTNLFTGLLHDARDHGPLIFAKRVNGARLLVSAKASRGERGSQYVSFPYPAFEEAVLSLL